VFYALLIITVAFLPIFALTGQAGRLFHPLAYTKTFVMFFGALVAITLVPALMMFLVRGKIITSCEHPVSRFLIKLYKPFVFVALRNPKTTIAIGVAAIISAIPMIPQIGCGVYAAVKRGRSPVHADDVSQHLGRRGQELHAVPGPGHSLVSRGDSGIWESGEGQKLPPTQRRFRCWKPSSSQTA